MNNDRKRALVIDDEEALLEIITEVLNILNIEPVTASTGIEALDIASKSNNSFDLMIIDLFLPQMNGEETCQKLRAYHPDCPVLFVSGYDGSEKKHAIDKNSKFLKKPFTIVNLQKTILDMI